MPIEGTERRRRADSKLTDDQLRLLHRMHSERGASIRELGRIVADQAGFASTAAAARAITRGFDRLHLPARSCFESRLMTMASGYPRCEEIRTNGERCGGFRLPGSDRCWSHHPEHREKARASALRNSPWARAVA